MILRPECLMTSSGRWARCGRPHADLQRTNPATSVLLREGIGPLRLSEQATLSRSRLFPPATASRLHCQMRGLGRRLGYGRRGRDVAEVDARRGERAVADELLDRVERCPSLHLAERPAMPEPVRVAALLDSGPGSEPLAQRPHVAVPQRPALERAEERMPSGEPESLPAVEPAIHGLGRIARERGGARLLSPLPWSTRSEPPAESPSCRHPCRDSGSVALAPGAYRVVTMSSDGRGSRTRLRRPRSTTASLPAMLHLLSHRRPPC